MASEGPNNPGTMADDNAVGSITWSSPNNAKLSDNNHALSGLKSGTAYEIRDVIVKIVKSDGSLGSENKADTGNNWPTTDTYKSYGASNDLWSESWNYTDINDVDFGVVLSCKETTENVQTHYLKASNFGFSIPAGATIDGILVEIERRNRKSFFGGDVTHALVDHMRVTVYYTETVGLNHKVKVAGTFATKKTIVKASGAFAEKPVLVKVSGTFQ